MSSEIAQAKELGRLTEVCRRLREAATFALDCLDSTASHRATIDPVAVIHIARAAAALRGSLL